MRKLWKRLVMLGALIGCMATAAWAGNVSIDVTEGYVYPLIEETVDGCYMTSISGIDQLGWDGYEEIEYHFDKDGRIA